MRTPNIGQPYDVVKGPDPKATVTAKRIGGFRLTCDLCGFSTVTEDGVHDSRMDDHRFLGHPAHRNPELTCHAGPVWNPSSWCMRPKGHEGKHWTPSFNGGVEYA